MSDCYSDYPLPIAEVYSASYFEISHKTRKNAQTGCRQNWFLHANDVDPFLCPLRALMRLAILYGEENPCTGPLFLQVKAGAVQWGQRYVSSAYLLVVISPLIGPLLDFKPSWEGPHVRSPATRLSQVGTVRDALLPARWLSVSTEVLRMVHRHGCCMGRLVAARGGINVQVFLLSQ